MFFRKRTPKIRPAQAHDLAQNHQGLLVCAYDDWNLCDRIRLEGGLTMQEFRHQLPGLSRDQAIVFYCT